MILAPQLAGQPSEKPAQLEERSLPALHQLISNNRAAMIGYHHFQQAGYYIGSALVEILNHQRDDYWQLPNAA